jgi:ABC-type sulfate transport system permease component
MLVCYIAQLCTNKCDLSQAFPGVVLGLLLALLFKTEKLFAGFSQLKVGVHGTGYGIIMLDS